MQMHSEKQQFPGDSLCLAAEKWKASTRVSADDSADVPELMKLNNV